MLPLAGDNFSPHGHSVASCTRITDDVHAVLCSRQEDIYAVRGPEKSALVIVVASNKTDDGDFSLLALKVVDCGDP